MCIKIKTNNEEILKAKFNDTIAKIEGYLTEAKGDISINTTYRASAVHNRIEKIKDCFMNDLANLAKDLKTDDDNA
jgi:hypothetical protein